MQVLPISNQNFKARVNMDMSVQEACRKSQKLSDVVSVIRDYVKCDEVFLRDKAIGNGLEGRIYGQSKHADGSIKDYSIGYYQKDGRTGEFQFFPEHIDWMNGAKDPVETYNHILYYS